MLLALASTSCKSQTTIVHKTTGYEVTVDGAKARENRILWLIDNLEVQELNVLERNREELVKLGDEAVPALLEALEKRPPLIRLGAAYCLGEIKNKKASGPLRRHLAGDTNLDVRRECAQALLSFKDYSGVPLLIEALRHQEKGGPDAGLWARYAAFRALQSTFQQSLGYQPHAAPDEREQAVRRWEAWWADNKQRYAN